MSAAHRHPPAFQVEAGPQPLLQGLLALLAVLSAGSLIAGLALHVPALGWLAVVLPLAGLCGWRLARIEARHLQWDGQLWRLAPAGSLDPGPPVEVEVLIDLGAWLLIRARQPGKRWPQRHYLPLARESVGANWGQLRATLFAARPERPSLT